MFVVIGTMGVFDLAGNGSNGGWIDRHVAGGVPSGA